MSVPLRVTRLYYFAERSIIIHSKPAAYGDKVRAQNMGDETNVRRQVDRYITDTIKIAAKVGNGQFSGKY